MPFIIGLLILVIIIQSIRHGLAEAKLIRKLEDKEHFIRSILYPTNGDMWSYEDEMFIYIRDEWHRRPMVPDDNKDYQR